MSDLANPTEPKAGRSLEPQPQPPVPEPLRPAEFGGRSKGLEPTRYGDWEKDGRCIDF